MNAVRALQDLYLCMDAAEPQAFSGPLALPSPPVTPSQIPDRKGVSTQQQCTQIPDRSHSSEFFDPSQINHIRALNSATATAPSVVLQHSPPTPSSGGHHLSLLSRPRTNTGVSDIASSPSTSCQSTLVPDTVSEIASRRTSDSSTFRRTYLFGLIKRRISPQSEASDTLAKESIRPSQNTPLSSPPSSTSIEASQARHGGYCEGAYFLQVGLKKESMKLRNEPSGIICQRYFWSCCSNKCCFEGPAVRFEKAWIFEEHIWTTSGVRFRWSFLAKSHVPIKRTKNKKFHYKCMFCEPQKKTSDVYRGIREFMNHVAEHNGAAFQALPLHNVQVVHGREAEGDEVFDINFTATPDSTVAGEVEKAHNNTGVKSDNVPVWELDDSALFGADMWR